MVYANIAELSTPTEDDQYFEGGRSRKSNFSTNCHLNIRRRRKYDRFPWFAANSRDNICISARAAAHAWSSWAVQERLQLFCSDGGNE